jgi:hypothetical protein
MRRLESFYIRDFNDYIRVSPLSSNIHWSVSAMVQKSNAILRATIPPSPDNTGYEVRIFQRPDGNFTRGNYEDENAPDTDHKGALEELDTEDMPLIWKLISGRDADD